MSGAITNVYYPLPSTTSAGAVAGQQISVTSGATSTFGAFNALTKLVLFDIQAANVYATIDGSTPSSTSGHILVAGEKYTWNKGMALPAKFVAVSTTAKIYLSELGV